MLPSGVMGYRYEADVVERDASRVVVTATWQHAAHDLGYTIFAPGDVFTEYYYADQWFNILRIDEATTGACRGWYCNICLPATLGEDEIVYVDLALDLWVSAMGQELLLDEEEFAAESLDDATRAGARAGLAELRRWVTIGLGPFADLAGQ
jgi:protein associated with RNAse G/E